MIILQVLNSGQPGGVEQHVLDLVSGLATKGHNLFVVCPKGPIVDWYKKAGAVVIVDSINLDIDPIFINRLIRIIKENKIKVVHAHEPKAVVNSLIAAKFAGNIPVITHTHTPMSEWQISNPIKRLLVKAEIVFYSFMVNAFASFEVALTLSRLHIKMTEGIKKDKLVVIPNGIDLSKFKLTTEVRMNYRKEMLNKYDIPEDAVVIGNVGRLTQEKGQKVLIDAYYEISNSFSNVYLLLAGGGLLQEQLQTHLNELNIQNKAKITGVFSDTDLLKYYASFDIFVFPTLAEGFGIVLTEAMTMGLPIIASDLSVLKEVGTKDIVYFSAGKYLDLENKIKELLKSDKSARIEIGERLKLYAEQNYSMNKFIQNYLELYESINAG